jgi:hypothetical protein
MRHISAIAVAGLLLLSMPAGARPSEDTIAAVEEALLRSDYEAVIELSKSLTESELDEVRFFRGLALFELGELEAARDELRRYLEAGGEFSRQARELMADLAPVAAPPRTRTRLQVQTGVLYDSHVIKSLREPPFFAEESDVALRGRVAIDVKSTAGLLLRYRGFALHYLDITEASRLEQSLAAGVQGEALGGSGEWTVVGESGLRDYQEDFWRFGTRGEIAWAVRTNRVAWVGLEGGQDSFPVAADFDGTYVLASTGYEQYFGAVSLFWDLYSQWHDAERDELGYLELGGGLVASRRVSNNHHTGLAARVSTIEFDEFDPFFDVTRSDTFFTVRAWFSLALNDRLSLVPSLEFVNSDSNVSFADYDEHRVGLDLVWTRW